MNAWNEARPNLSGRMTPTRALALLLLVSGLAFGETSLTAFGYRWAVTDASDWNVARENNSEILQLLHARGPLPGPRRPIQFALAGTAAFSRVTVAADVRPNQRSLILVFAYQDPAHFNYAHLSIDTGLKERVHNGIFHVFGGERVRISSQAGPAAFAATGRWYHVILQHDGRSGDVQVTVDGHAVPALHAVDLSLLSGKIGLGSFDETGEFKNVTIAGTRPAR